MKENSYISYFKIQDNYTISIRITTERVNENGEIVSLYWRIVLEPGEHTLEDYIDNEELLSMAKSAWTQEVIDNYQAWKNQLLQPKVSTENP